MSRQSSSGSAIRYLLVLTAFTSVFGIEPASARPTPADYDAIELNVSPGAALPTSQTVTDESGRNQRLSALIDRPTVLVFADYHCHTLCGPTVAFVAAALEKSGLGTDRFRLLVIGLGSNVAADAARMRRDHLEQGGIVDRAARFTTTDETSIRAMTGALGFHYRYDAESGQYIHPAAAYVLTSAGRVSRVLTGLGFTADSMRLALIEAANGKIGTFGDRVRLICSAFDPAHGTYNLMISRILAAAGLATVTLIAAGLGFLALTNRRTA
jgi:protein SCO1/2